MRDAPEKLFVMNFPHLMPPTLISRDLDEINSFRDEHGAVVMKPLHGHGGAAVFRVMPQDMNFGSLFDMFSVTFREPWVIQRFLPEVKHGDKRIILVDGEFAGAVNRVPAPDDLRSNMVRGGAAQATELSAREREICDTLGPALRERGLLFVGIDVIDGNLTEINVTSPTGIRAIAAAQRPGCRGEDLGHHREEARREIISPRAPCRQWESEMDDRTVRAALQRHWEASDANDFDAEHEIYREDAVLDYPQSGERIRGRRNIQESRFVQPNKKRFTVRRMIGSGDLWVTEFVLTYDGIPSYAVSIMEFRDGLVASETQYFADRFDPAPSRAHLVERVG